MALLESDQILYQCYSGAGKVPVTEALVEREWLSMNLHGNNREVIFTTTRKSTYDCLGRPNHRDTGSISRKRQEQFHGD